MSPQTVAKTSLVIKRLTGADLDTTRTFLRKQCFVEGKGFSSQYPGQEIVSCATTAICAYALSETGPLTRRERNEFQRILLAFRLNSLGAKILSPKFTEGSVRAQCRDGCRMEDGNRTATSPWLGL